MGLKRLIKEAKIAKEMAKEGFTIAGLPLIYTIKYELFNHKHPLQFFRDKQWRTMLRCIFPNYHRHTTPVVLLVTFYVPAIGRVDQKKLHEESIPAACSYELADYLLSFLEMLRGALFVSYRQLVKIDMSKFYSNNPRTVFKFMHWNHYVQNQNTLYPRSKSIGKAG